MGCGCGGGGGDGGPGAVVLGVIMLIMVAGIYTICSGISGCVEVTPEREPTRT